jgi:hypothetical protein
MAGSFIVSGSNTTIKLEYTAATAKISAIVLVAARYFYDIDAASGKPPTVAFDSMTNQQMLDLIDKHVRTFITEASLRQKITEAAVAAAAAANADLAI